MGRGLAPAQRHPVLLHQEQGRLPRRGHGNRRLGSPWDVPDTTRCAALGREACTSSLSPAGCPEAPWGYHAPHHLPGGGTAEARLGLRPVMEPCLFQEGQLNPRERKGPLGFR